MWWRKKWFSARKNTTNVEHPARRWFWLPVFKTEILRDGHHKSVFTWRERTGSESAEMFPTCRSPESSQVPNEHCKGALHSLMILWHASPTQAAADSPHQGVNAQLLWSLPSLWSGKVSGLAQDSLAARSQGLSDPLANDWKAEAKCLSWLFFYHQAGHGIWGFPGHSTTSRVLRGSCTDRSNFSTPDCSCSVPMVLGMTPRVTGMLQQHCSTSLSFYSSQDLCP